MTAIAGVKEFNRGGRQGTDEVVRRQLCPGEVMKALAGKQAELV
jgi:hypothetical protein